MWQWDNLDVYENNLAQGNIELNLRFTEQYYDAESGFHYNIHRTYNPEIGRIAENDGTSTGLAAFLTTMTNVRLKDSILGKLRNPSNEEILKAANAVSQIKLELMQGYDEYLAGACKKKPIKPSIEFITNLHHTVFQRNGADSDILGGSTVDKNYLLDLFIRTWGGYDWCPNCSK